MKNSNHDPANSPPTDLFLEELDKMLNTLENMYDILDRNQLNVSYGIANPLMNRINCLENGARRMKTIQETFAKQEEER